MQRVIRSLSWWCAMAGGALFGIVVLVTVVNVGGFILNAVARLADRTVPGLPGYEDAVSLLVGLGALLMLPWCQLQRGHVSVDLFTSLLSDRALRRLTRVTDAVMGCLAGFLAVMLVRGTLSYRADGVRTPVLEWLVWPFMVPGAAAIALWAAVAFYLAAQPEALDDRPASGGD
ncbi:MAG: TRAP transporter small permease subunit [Pseudomonadota bacterium]